MTKKSYASRLVSIAFFVRLKWDYSFPESSFCLCLTHSTFAFSSFLYFEYVCGSIPSSFCISLSLSGPPKMFSRRIMMSFFSLDFFVSSFFPLLWSWVTPRIFRT